MSVPLPKTDHPLDFLRYLTAQICDAVIELSDSNTSTAQAEDACGQLHFFATELCLMTVDVRKGRN
jgi:hypothetical protein